MLFQTNLNVVLSVRKKEKNTPINYNTKYCRENKLVPANMDYCLLQFDALNFFLGVPSKWDLHLILILSM